MKKRKHKTVYQRVTKELSVEEDLVDILVVKDYSNNTNIIDLQSLSLHDNSGFYRTKPS